jgi:hypothetical protein
VLAGGCLGALLLVVAEFLTLYTLHVSSSLSPIASTTTGAHNSYALIPLGLLAALMALASRGLRNPAALIALTGLGVVALLIALLGDLPDAHAHGITGHLQLATTSAGEGLYVETLGGFLLLVTGGMALLAGAPTFRFPSVPRPSRRNPRRARSES